MADPFNIAQCLPARAAAAPTQIAVIVSRRGRGRLQYQSITYAELESLSNRYANALTAGHVRRGMRTLLMVRQGFDFVALVFALFKVGAVPVLIDPGMGVARLLECIRTVSLDAFVGIPLAQVVRTLRPGPFATVKTFVTVGRCWFWGGPTLSSLLIHSSDDFSPAPTARDETAAILFTSGSTGPAKGVLYEHGMFDAQIRMIQSAYGIQPGEIDLPTFPLFALFSVGLGMTIVLPDMDPSHPARVNPWNIIDAIRDQKVTNTFGSPALWRRVAACCTEGHPIELPTLRRILIAGAPVPPPLIEQLHRVLSPDADVHTPYGATESLPVSTISGREVIGSKARRHGGTKARSEGRDATCRPGDRDSLERNLDTIVDSQKVNCANQEIENRQSTINNSPPSASYTLHAAGTCVGLPVAGTHVRIIRISDDAVGQWSADLQVVEGEVGEICVTGPAITRAYFGLPQANALSKIPEGDTVWHRIGDVGYVDELGRLWFCGRKAHRVGTSAGTLFTECIEPLANQHPAVARSALVGLGLPGDQTPVLVVELKPGRRGGKRSLGSLAPDLIDFLGDLPAGDARGPLDGRPLAVGLRQMEIFKSQVANRRFQVLFRKSLPVDIRHNAKINRELLAQWAVKKRLLPSR